jgi:hypothetical protein
MESLLWAMNVRDPFAIAGPLLLGFAIAFLVVQSNFVGLVLAWLWRLAFWRRPDRFQAGRVGRPAGLVIIPSLLRNKDDLNAIQVTVESCATNGYPSELIIIASIDGRTENPELCRELTKWVETRPFPDNVHVYIGGTPTRLGKMMAVEAGVALMKELVARGAHAAFPKVYFSIDGDGTLCANALERLCDRLTAPHPITGNPRRVVAGKVCIRPDLFWQGWTWKSLRNYFTIKGQIYRQVAREFFLSNVSRYNWRLQPHVTIPGALYCTWTELLLMAPHYMRFMQGIRVRQMVRWWLGGGPPRFSASDAAPLPEALTGASDDTCMGFLASMATWRNGRLSLDAPPTPLHAIGRLVRQLFCERSHGYEPEARVYTYTPTTIKALWVQRVRWNSSRFECTGRFWHAFAFHWEIGVPVLSHLLLEISHFLWLGACYLLLPYCLVRMPSGLAIYVIAYVAQSIGSTFFALLALLLEREWRKFWPVLLALPLAPVYSISIINCFACITGVAKDFLFFGNSNKFAPEWTLKAGRTERIALLFRTRRFLALSVRALVCGDVPFGRFWLGWHETAWTPSGYDGWTTGKRRAIIPPLRSWFRASAQNGRP